MVNLFSAETRRNPYPLYDQFRSSSPLLRVPPPFNAWMIFDYEGVIWALTDHEAFSSRVPAPQWFIFSDAPAHTKLRALVSQAFTPRMVANLDERIRELSGQLLDQTIERGEMDLANEFSVPLAMKVIAGIIGIPLTDWARYKQWSDVILRLSYTRSGGEEAQSAMRDFTTVTVEMDACLADMIEQRRAAPRDDLLTRLMAAEVNGEKLSQQEILGFFQLLIVAGQETTANLINNAVLCLMEAPDQLARIRAMPELLPATIEEVLRYRSPVQWMMRTPRRDVDLHGQMIPAGQLVLAMIGSANRDPRHFPNAGRFDIDRDPNPHVGFGRGIHFCLGAALSRLESKIALGDLLERFKNFELASDEPWQPREALNVHGPASLPIRFEVNHRAAAPA
jgi:cytochrome P450